MNAIGTAGLAAAILAFAAVPAAAQATDEPETLVTTDECEVAPLEDGTPPPAHATPDSLSDTLDPCDGVLRPAPVGDTEMTVAPPEGGETPIIEPDELPPQPPQGE